MMASLRFEGLVSQRRADGTQYLLLSNPTHFGQRFDITDLTLLFRMYTNRRMTIQIDVEAEGRTDADLG